MDFDPNYYNDFTDSILPANKLINKINEMSNNNNNMIVLDIGCGTGSTTKLLTQLNPNRIIGCDIDSKMVGFAQKYNKTSKIDYLVQDFGVQWDKLDSRVKQMAGKVTAIFTNYAMAWVWDKQCAAENIARLLAPDGIFVGNILYDGDIFQSLPESERLKAYELVPYPTEMEFMGGWLMALKNAGLTKIDVEYWEPKIIMSEKLYLDEYINIPMNWFKHYSQVTNEDMDSLMKKLIYAERCRRIDQLSTDGMQQIEIINRLWQVVAQKHY
ncbi:uncharacterized protein LOC128964284 [Oppia nitens]|uniref:uncharacterized protein LOC128964284 n=1 Tax=Oppia nitens TaxID=1686743 RepID=UPI0023DA18E0|nr:uncharacterized protein LOC128964284 [Oppia nitens]